MLFYIAFDPREMDLQELENRRLEVLFGLYEQSGGNLRHGFHIEEEARQGGYSEADFAQILSNLEAFDLVRVSERRLDGHPLDFYLTTKGCVDAEKYYKRHLDLAIVVDQDAPLVETGKEDEGGTFDIRAALARLNNRPLDFPGNSFANEQAVSQYNLYLEAAKERYRESLDIKALSAFTSLTKPEVLRDSIDRLADALSALPDDGLGDSPMLSPKFGILRSETQLELDYSTYVDDNGGLGLLFFDIDHFKGLNTKHTETIVDRSILAPFQRLLNDIIQSRGFAYSVGGDEFIALLRNVDPNEAEAFALRLVDSVREHMFSVEGEDEKLTISVGLACHPDDADTLPELRELANRAENEAKHGGRDRMIRSRG